MNKVILTGNSLTLEDVVKVAREYAEVSIDDSAIKDVEASRKIVDDIVENERVVYGVTTGFGSLCNVSISKEDSSQLHSLKWFWKSVK